MKRPRMTYRQFLTELRRMRLSWKLGPNKQIRAEIPGYSLMPGYSFIGCPLIAVQVRRKILDVRWGFRRAAENLGLGVSVAEKIADMADGKRPLDPAFKRALGLP